MKCAMVLAGLDPTGGAGLTSDVHVIRSLGIYACGIPTSITVQTGKNVLEIRKISSSYFNASLDAILETLPVKGVKIGMIHSPGIARSILSFLKDRLPEYTVLDPVITSSGGIPLTTGSTLDLMKKIIPHCTLITPNIDELKTLSELYGIKGKWKELARELSRITEASVLVTGGHMKKHRGTDHLFSGGTESKIQGKFQVRRNFHGTGCLYSSAILAYLLKGYTLNRAIILSRKFVEKKVASGFPSLDGRWFLGA
jgi:hydroxymethylpyrimidine/phosphomethylpyrimidine kinase